LNVLWQMEAGFRILFRNTESSHC